MKKILSIFLFLVFILGGILLFVNKDILMQEIVIYDEPDELPKIKSSQSTKEMKQLLEGDLFEQINQTSSNLSEEFGEPTRKDLTPYGYTWWVYTDEQTNSIQFGVNEDNTVQTIYATGEEIDSEPFIIGNSYDEIEKNFPFKQKITYQTGLSFYTFILNQTDIEMIPLIKLDDEIFVQLYFNTFTDKLSSVRILTGDTLLKQRFYEMEYRGSLPDEENLSEDEWKQIEKGMENQIFELTNIHRHHHDYPLLIKDEKASEVALLH